MFNAKREKTAQIKPTEKMLRDQFDSTEGTPVITTKQLDDNRKNPDGLQIGEKQLDKERVANTGVILEKQMDGNETWTKRTNETSIPIMDMALKNSQDEEAAFAKKNKVSMSDYEKDFWDAYVDTGTDKKVYTGTARSQLLSNYKSRKAMNKANPSKSNRKNKAASLQDADAMLYHLYRQASIEDRELSNDEKQLVNNINSNKINIIAQMLEAPSLDAHSKNLIDSVLQKRKMDHLQDYIENGGLTESNAISMYDMHLFDDGGKRLFESVSDELGRQIEPDEMDYIKRTSSF